MSLKASLRSVVEGGDSFTARIGCLDSTGRMGLANDFVISLNARSYRDMDATEKVLGRLENSSRDKKTETWLT